MTSPGDREGEEEGDVAGRRRDQAPDLHPHGKILAALAVEVADLSSELQ